MNAQKGTIGVALPASRRGTIREGTRRMRRRRGRRAGRGGRANPPKKFSPHVSERKVTTSGNEIKIRPQDKLIHSVLRNKDLNGLIASFAGNVSALPIAIQGRVPPKALRIGKSPNEMLIFYSTILSIPWDNSDLSEEISFFTNEMKNSSLELNYWYEVQMRRLGIDPTGIISLSNPFKEEVSREVAKWYFERTYGDRGSSTCTYGSLERLYSDDMGRWEKKFNTKCKGKGTGCFHAADIQIIVASQWLMYYYGVMKLEEIPLRALNIVSCLNYHRYDIARVFFGRGDQHLLTSNHIISLDPMGIDFVLREMGYRDQRLLDDLINITVSGISKENLVALINNLVVPRGNSLFYFRFARSRGSSLTRDGLMLVMREILPSVGTNMIHEIEGLFFPLIRRLLEEKESPSMISDFSQLEEIKRIFNFLKEGDEKKALIELSVAITRNEDGERTKVLLSEQEKSHEEKWKEIKERISENRLLLRKAADDIDLKCKIIENLKETIALLESSIPGSSIQSPEGDAYSLGEIEVPLAKEVGNEKSGVDSSEAPWAVLKTHRGVHEKENENTKWAKPLIGSTSP